MKNSRWKGSKPKLKLYWEILKKTLKRFNDTDAYTYASSIAFSTILSLPALLLIAAGVGAMLYEETSVRSELHNQVSDFVGQKSAGEIMQVMQNSNVRDKQLLFRIMGIAALLLSATTVFLSLQSGLNKVWSIKSKPKKAILWLIVNRLLTLAFVFGIGFLLLASIILDTAIVYFQKKLFEVLPDITVYLFALLNIVFSLAFITVIFALIFKILPSGRIRWKDVWVGSFVTAGLFVIGKFLIGIYLGGGAGTTAYGAAGSVLLIFIWVYYSALLILFGASFTYSYSAMVGKHIEPEKNAVAVRMVEISNGTGKNTGR